MKSHNLDVIRRALRERNGDFLDEECLAILNELGNFVLEWLKNKTYTYEDQTYNLTDSTGCAIYKNGKLTKFKYVLEKQAKKPRIITYQKEKITVRGRQLLSKALKTAPLETMGTYTLAVISEAPYGVWVNESLGSGGPNKRGKGWFDDLKKEVERKFEEIKAAYANKK